MKQYAVIVENLSYRYNDSDEWVLKNISFKLRHGEILGIIGPTGVGKTTLAMTLNSLIPSMVGGEIEGLIRVGGKDVSQHSVAEMSESVGFVFQDPENQISQMNIEEEIAFGLGNLGVAREKMPQIITQVLKLVDLEGFEKRSPLALSGGQQQRLAIASVLAMQPQIMILDEPTTMLDPKGKNEVYQVLAKLRQNNMTGIIIDHEVERLAAYCDKILLLYGGEIKMFGSPEAIFSQPEKLHQFGIHAPQVANFAASINRQQADFFKSIPVTFEQAITTLSPFCQEKSDAKQTDHCG